MVADFVVDRVILFILLFYLSGIGAQPIRTGETSENTGPNDQMTQLFYNILAFKSDIHDASLEFIDNHWHPSFAPALIDLLVITDQPKIKRKIFDLLEKHTGQRLGKHLYDWLEWLWGNPPVYAPFYSDLKARMYRNIDPRFSTYFMGRHDETEIRLDEILWGGVQQDGIPPLRYPSMIAPDEAGYLFKKDIIFGIVVNGEARAYPKRILGWHEMVVDSIGGRAIAGVYCTLCGTMIAYDTEYDGVLHELGTSGFLYRSNKLMYDRATQSLWNTIEGRPVVGPLIDQNITLNTYPVVTTTWENWRKRHPGTKVLSVKTGFQRDYDPGAAYRVYYATDDLMFPVPLSDKRLNNKEEVLVVRADGYEQDPLAISVDFLKKNRIYNDQINGQNIVVISDEEGGARVYASTGKFTVSNNGLLRDQFGINWNMEEEYLINQKGDKLNRLPAHNIFWFAWYNTYPHTRLQR